MANSKVISIRIDERLLADLDVCVRSHRYYKRNNVIEKAVEMFVRDLSHDQQHIVLRHYRLSPKKIVCTVEEVYPEK